jgi:excisionase family DNA binding protein
MRQPKSSPADPAPVPNPFEGRIGVSIREAARAIGVDDDTVHRMARDGRLTRSKIGRRSIIHTASIQKLMTDTVVAPEHRTLDAPTPVRRPVS